MILFISYGDHLEKGEYRVHSRFSHAVNFISGDDLATVVHPSVGGGPFNLVVEGVNLSVIDKLKIGDDSFFLNDEIIPLDDSKKYYSEIKLHGFDEQLFKDNLLFLEEILIQRTLEKSLVFLLDESRRKYFKTGFEIELVRRFDSAIKCFRSSDIMGATRKIKGAGFGLTPSGDDFIAGFLTALNLSSKILDKDYSKTITGIVLESRSGNFLSGAFLYAASRGWLTETFKDLIHSLLYRSREVIQERLMKVFTHGETSGADWCVGFLYGLNETMPQRY